LERWPVRRALAAAVQSDELRHGRRTRSPIPQARFVEFVKVDGVIGRLGTPIARSSPQPDLRRRLP
jgi:hypothetical protein